jgi:Uma2 family endonuclease
MATAPALPSVSVEEYLKTDYEPHCEYLDGVLLTKSLPDQIHSRLQTLLAAYLLSQEAKFKLAAVTEIHVRISPTRWRIPDVGGLSAPPVDGRYPDQRTPPLFTIESVIWISSRWCFEIDPMTDLSCWTDGAHFPDRSRR